ncbi:MAG: ABC transporter permease [Steroidobacteraceae bacterium]
MNTRAILALARNDLRLFFTDRRAVIVGVLVPILIAAFFGYVFGGNGSGEAQEAGKVPIAVVDEDQSTVTRAILADLTADAMLDVQTLTREAAGEQVRKGTRQAAAVFPQGFGEQSVAALFSGRDKPRIELLVDPSQAISARLVQGLLAQYSMQDISREAFNGVSGRAAADDMLARLDALPATAERSELRTLLGSVRRLNELNDKAAVSDATAADGAGFQLGIPYEVTSTPMVARAGTPYNGYAHSFAGMAVQFILFAGIDAGVVLLLLRQRGIWQRIRSAPISKGEFILSRLLATALVSAFQMAVIYAAAALVFGVRIMGSAAGLVLVAVAFCLLNAAFGLMLATLGRSAAATRGIATMVMLLMVMLGGAWVPAFVFPAWLQQASLFTPTRWAVDGLDAMTWRGLPFGDALLPTLVLAGCALLFFVVAVWRFRWEE